MFDTSSNWLMTSLNPDPMMVSAVQVATTLPMFLLTLPAGALTDIIDARRMLIGAQLAVTAVSIVFAAIVTLHLATPSVLLATTFCLGGSGALAAPAWLVVTPMLVPKSDLDSAIAINNTSYNISRAVGPALGGLAIAAFGIALPFWCFCVGNIAVLAALIWWRVPRRSRETLPAERLVSALRTGLRYARNNRDIDSTLIRAVAFFLFASAYWALLPLVARAQMHNGPEVYGVLLGMIGVGSILGLIRAQPPQGAPRSGPSGDAWRAGHNCRARAVRRGARARHRGRCEPDRGRVVDHHDDHAVRFCAGGSSRVGARTGSGDFSDSVFRCDDARQRGLGQGRQPRRGSHRAVPRRGWRGGRDGFDRTVETADRRRRSTSPRRCTGGRRCSCIRSRTIKGRSW